MIKLLYVDDEPGILEIVKFVLEANDAFSVDLATSAFEGLELLRRNEYDAIISDFQMPQRNGIELLHDVREMHSNIPFVLFTNVTDPEVAREALTNGADLFVEKYGNIVSRLDIMAEKLATLVERRRNTAPTHESIMGMRLLIDSIPDLLVLSDTDMNVNLANQACAKELGASVTGGWNVSALMHPEDLDNAHTDIYRSLLEGGKRPIEFRIRAANGRYVWVEALPRYHYTGSTISGIALSMRLNGKRREEMAQLEEEKKKLDLLLGLTRHDLLNNITTAEVYLATLLEALEEKHKRRYAEKALTLVQGMRNQLQMIKQYQELGVYERQWVDVGEAIDRACSTIELGSIRVEHDMNGLELFSDPMLDRVFHNIITNSVMHGETTTQIEMAFQTSKSGFTITIEDDGIGIPQRDKQSIFEYGYQDRRGHGLHFVRELLGRSGISIREIGTPGLGCQFEILVPEGLARHTMDESRVKYKVTCASAQRSA